MIDSQASRLAGVALAQAASFHETGDRAPIALFLVDGKREAIRFSKAITPGQHAEAYRVVADQMDAGGHGALVVAASVRLADGRTDAIVVHIVASGAALIGTVTQAVQAFRASLIPGRSRAFRAIGELVLSDAIDDEQTRRSVIGGVLSHPEALRLFPALASITASASRVPEAPPRTEGVYAGHDEHFHYALEGASRTLCGRSMADRWRHASSWRFVETDRRCPRCDVKVGKRGEGRHGPVTEADMFLYGVEPPETMPDADRAWYRDAYERGRRRDEELERHASAFEASTVPNLSDPPFEYAKDPRRPRRSGESDFDRVINDVYVRMRTGKKWHRVYETHAPSTDPILVPYGRTFLFPCGNSGSDLERDEHGQFQPMPIRTEIPPADEICGGCATSDRKHGKGDIPNRGRWDR